MRFSNALNQSIYTLALVLILSALAVKSYANPQQTLVTGGTVTPPWFIDEAPMLTDGYCKAVFTEALERLDILLVTIPMSKPRADTSLQSGKIQGVLCASPKWYKNVKPSMAATLPIASASSIILMNEKNAARFSSPDDLEGKTIATIIGFQYDDSFQNILQKKDLKRRDVTTGKSALRMLLSDRVDAAILDKNEAQWLLQREFAGAPVEEVYAFPESTDISLLLANDKQRLIPLINNALKEMQRDGTMSYLKASYFEPPVEH